MEQRVVKNIEELATTPLRADAIKILESGYGAIETGKVVRENVAREGGRLSYAGKQLDLRDFDRVYFVGIGKCAADAAVVFEEMLGEYISSGIIVDVRGATLKKITSRVGTHPLPSKENIAAAQSIKELLEQATERDLVIAVISGGGSALLCLPHDLQCEMLIRITETLMKKGASIAELNTVRKHLSLIQGGGFAKLAYPARVISFIFSDVPGDDISVVASGPTVMDTTTKEDAERILAKYDVLAVCELPNCEVLETTKEEKYFQNVENVLVLTNKTALEAMVDTARILGYGARIVTAELQGEARAEGERIARGVEVGMCLLYGGETTVTVRGEGVGGRNQELVLGALPYIGEESIVVAAASDGWDNSDVAGALGDRALLEEAKRRELDPQKFLDMNDSYAFFAAAGGHIKTGRRGSNVSDLYFTLTK